MKKGYEVQKKSIVSNLQIYVTPDFASNNELLPTILNSIEMWDTEFQCLLAQSLRRTVCMSQELGRPTVSSRNLRKAVELCLNFTDNMDSEDLHTSWSVIFRDLAFQMNFMDNETELQRQGALGQPKISESLKSTA